MDGPAQGPHGQQGTHRHLQSSLYRGQFSVFPQTQVLWETSGAAEIRVSRAVFKLHKMAAVISDCQRHVGHQARPAQCQPSSPRLLFRPLQD